MDQYHIKTFGCQMNISDSQRLATFLETQGFSETANIDDAHYIIINTCGVRQMAEDRAYGLVHNIHKHDKSKHIILTGCIAHRADVQKRLGGKVTMFTQIKDFPKDFLATFGKPAAEYENRDYLAIPPKQTSTIHAHVPIMTGCNNFCAYCTVPFARGREISRPTTEIISEVEHFLKKGFKHITLLGQNVNSYYDITKKNPVGFPRLLQMVNALPGKFWISFVSSHPKDMTSELIETIAKSKKVCEWVHLPIQAGDNAILKKMNRKYTQEQYMERVRKIRSAFKTHKPNALFSLSSDIIVGFPGETRKQFMESASVMEKAKYDMVFFGQFSPRPETAAWRMKETVSNKEKQRREYVLNQILKKTTLANNKKYIGKVFEVLIEKEKDAFYYGKTRSQKNVKIPVENKKGLVGKFSKVLITKANLWNLEGKFL